MSNFGFLRLLYKRVVIGGDIALVHTKGCGRDYVFAIGEMWQLRDFVKEFEPALKLDMTVKFVPWQSFAEHDLKFTYKP